MTFSKAGKAALRKIGAGRAWDESKHPRVAAGSGDPSGQFAATTVGPESEALFDRLSKDGRKRTWKEMVEEARLAGIPKPLAQYNEWRRLNNLKKKGALKPEEQKPLLKRGSHLEVLTSPHEISRKLIEDLRASKETDRSTLASIAEHRLKNSEHNLTQGIHQRHGMRSGELMIEIPLERQRVHYAKGDRLARRSAAGLFVTMARGDLPSYLTDATQRVFISTQSNRQDEVLTRKLGHSFTSAATGGDGHVVFYMAGLSVGDKMNHANYIHEMAHNMATRTYGSPSLRSGSPIDKVYSLWSKDPNMAAPPTVYGRTNVAEAYAEAITTHYMVRGGLEYRGAYRLSPSWQEAANAELKYAELKKI